MTAFTRKLTAVLKLQPCQTYHIRLVVADVGDNFYDSAVFLVAESFNTGGKVKSLPLPASARKPFHGRMPGCLFFSSNARVTVTCVSHDGGYTVSPGNRPAGSIDFEPLSGNVTIPSGRQFIQVPVSLINDGLPEPTENIILELDIPCACYTDTARMFIADSPPISVRLEDFGVCEMALPRSAP